MSEEPREQPRPVRQEVYRRKAPRYRAFIVTGALLGVLVGAALTTLNLDAAPQYSLGTRLGYLCAIFGLLGALLGGGLAVLTERPRR